MNYKKTKVYCPYSVLDLEWGTLKNLQNITFKKPWYLKETTMTQEDKQLLLKDLCSRLPYGVIVKENDGVNENDNKLLDIDMFDGCINYDYIIEDIKPYLRPMSSMTENEKKRLMEISEEYLDDWSTADSNLLKWKAVAKASSRRTTFYNSHYLDCNGLIEKGLALEAPEDMYKTE